jgi:pimeloyl-ACP methyl ester carboxylesterase
MLPLLARHFSITVPDLPGHGASPNLPSDVGDVSAEQALFSLEDYSAKLAMLLDAMPHKALVVGHSLGALIALDLAVKYPSQLAAVVPLNSIYRRTEVASKAVKARAAELSLDNRSDPSQTLDRWFGEAPTDALANMADQCRDWLNCVDPLGYRRAYQVFANADGPANRELENLACPALFITGAEEPNSTPAMSQAMAERVPDGEVVVLEDARHMTPMTHATQVSQHILGFHQRLGAPNV